MGAFMALGAFVYAGFMIVRTLTRGNPVPGYPSILVAILLLGDMQLVGLGIIGEYLCRMFNETKGRPIYVIKEYRTSRSVLEEWKMKGVSGAVSRCSSGNVWNLIRILFQSEDELGGKYMRDRVRAIMADVFMIDLSYISETTSMKTLSQWDSMAQLHLITALEEEFNITFDVEDFEIMTNFTRVLDTLEAKL
jgi:acyl carrier protein